jgi:hypothetical protein
MNHQDTKDTKNLYFFTRRRTGPTRCVVAATGSPRFRGAVPASRDRCFGFLRGFRKELRPRHVTPAESRILIAKEALLGVLGVLVVE